PDEAGWYALHVNANDIAVRGARPTWFLATVLLPEGGGTEATVERLFADLGEACAELGVALIGGHTEVTAGLPRAIVSGCMLGEVEKDRLGTTGGGGAGRGGGRRRRGERRPGLPAPARHQRGAGSASRLWRGARARHARSHR